MKSVDSLSCIHCNREFAHKEVFVAFFNEQGVVIVANHLNCGYHSDKKERKGTGWGVLQRNFNHYELLNPPQGK